MTANTKGSKNKTPDLGTLLRARATCLWVTTREELRVERASIEQAARVGFKAVTWDCYAGLLDESGLPFTNGGKLSVDREGRVAVDPELALGAMRTTAERRVWIFRDLDAWLASPTTLRAVKSLARDLQGAEAGAERCMIILSTGEKPCPAGLAPSVVRIDWPLPDRGEISRILGDTVSATRDGLVTLRDEAVAAGDTALAGKADARLAKLDASVKNGAREAAIDAAAGLTSEETASVYAQSLVACASIDPDRVRKDKARVVSGIPGLEWCDADPRGLDAVGGLDVLKGWLRQRRAGFTPKAREYGLPAPKGVLLVGPPGTGKSLVAKTVAAAWGFPLLRMDLGALKSKWVGESEGNLRRALQVAESMAPCCVHVDEIEKALAGAAGAQGDGGVSTDALGAILTWLQDRAGAVFCVATANDVTSLPPELLRKGRFDEIFFVDLPTAGERAQILAAALKSHGRDPAGFDCRAVVAGLDGFSGAEIASLVPEAMFIAFNQDRELVIQDLVAVSERVVPLSRTAADKITAVREWAKGRARRASSDETLTAKLPVTSGRRVDLG